MVNEIFFFSKDDMIFFYFYFKKEPTFFFIIALLNVYIYLCTDIGFKKNTHKKFTSANIFKSVTKPIVS